MDTRNELMETLNNVSTGKGFREFYCSVGLDPIDSLQSCHSEPLLQDSNFSQFDSSCTRFQIQSQGQTQIEEQSKELLQEQLLTSDCYSRPNTPPPQLESKPRDKSPLLGRIPVKKVVQKPSRPVRRRLFDPPSPGEVEDWLSSLEQRDQKKFMDRYNFDPLKDEPLPGRFEWVPLRPQRSQLKRTTSGTEIRRPQAASTMSA